MVTFKLRHEQRGDHVHVDMFVGNRDRSPNLALAGRLVLLEDEWRVLVSGFALLGELEEAKVEVEGGSGT